MGYREDILQRIEALDQRRDERRVLWQTISDRFETEGAVGAADELTKQMGDLEKKISDALATLDGML